MKKQFVVFADFPQAKAVFAMQEWRGGAVGFQSATRKAMKDFMQREGIKGIHHHSVKIVVQLCNGAKAKGG
ncbi:MAG: hypothetical protein ACREI9_05680 [Nitrospiraceae bacterium]